MPAGVTEVAAAQPWPGEVAGQPASPSHGDGPDVRTGRPLGQGLGAGTAGPPCARGTPMTTTFNPFDPEQVDDQDEILAELRPRCPVAEVMPGVFLLTRYDDVVRASRD